MLTKFDPQDPVNARCSKAHPNHKAKSTDGWILEAPGPAILADSFHFPHTKSKCTCWGSVNFSERWSQKVRWRATQDNTNVKLEPYIHTNMLASTPAHTCTQAHSVCKGLPYIKSLCYSCQFHLPIPSLPIRFLLYLLNLPISLS